MALKPTDDSIQSLWTMSIVSGVILSLFAYFYAPEEFKRFFQPLSEREISSKQYSFVYEHRADSRVSGLIQDALADDLITYQELQAIEDALSTKALLISEMGAK
ncbi:hypothetical protein DLR60_16980 [Vibrio tarriae]|uniref:hypothetical protein n=1 Tax=Vibrio tarriae TaxID=2014742 RepID=UPI000DE2B136|nr:hypothetical protein [Vibrio tarriae]RBM66404.1 hypothetical protein DLR60_16980 [Vibrio tarriae]